MLLMCPVDTRHARANADIFKSGNLDERLPWVSSRFTKSRGSLLGAAPIRPSLTCLGLGLGLDMIGGMVKVLVLFTHLDFCFHLGRT
jgi:hypothetical protein